jgi:type II secretion system protein I
LGQAKRRPNALSDRLVGSSLRSTQPTAGTRGFTLIEALAAIAILALALGALLSAHDTAVRGAGAIDDQLQARLLAQSLLAQYSQSRLRRPPSQGRSGRFAWSVSMAPLAKAGGEGSAGSADWRLHELTVTVAWTPRHQLRLTTLRLLRVP